MSTVEDFENAPVGATATHPGGARAMKIDDGEQYWITPTGLHVSNEHVWGLAYTLDPSASTTASEALEIAWELAHEVKPGQVIPKGTQCLKLYGSEARGYTAPFDLMVNPEGVPIRTVEPLPDPEPEWLDAPAVLATPGWGPDRGVWVPVSGGVWKCACCRDERHWYELHDVTPLYPKERAGSVAPLYPEGNRDE